MKSFRSVLFLIVLTTLSGCKQETQPVAETASAPEPAMEAPPVAEPVTLSEGFSTPESVLYDADQDVYLISNINGSPFEADDNGYISRLTAEGHQMEAKWIDGAAEEVQLNAPKGMAIVGEELWVADVTSIRRFDRRSGQPKGSIDIPGAGFLNDMVADGSGGAYVSDSGLKATADAFAPSGTDAIYRVSGDSAEKIASGDVLNRPNGLAMQGGKLWVVTFGSKELFSVENGQKAGVQTLPQGSLDGLVALEDGTVLISSWEGNAIYHGPAAGPFEPLVENVPAPADIGFDTKRNLILIPLFNDNQVILQPMQR